MTLAASLAATAGDGPPDGRTQHYGVFYGVKPLLRDDRPLVVVVGNCQAESVRLLLDGTPSGAVRSVRVPPVFELDGPETARLHELVSRADVLVSQPVRPGYRGYALGTEELAASLPRHGRVVRFPAFRYAGLFPWQVVLRVGGVGDPPGVPYSDLRTIVEVATGARPGPMRADGIRAVAAASIAELQRREDAAGAVRASDLVASAGVEAAHVVNHPGNPVLVGVARRVQAALGLPVDACDPGRTLLREVYAPLTGDVFDALGLDAEPRPAWRYRGADLTLDQVRQVQLPWLAAHPEVVDHAMTRHAQTITTLGWL